MARAYSVERSQATTSMPGRARSRPASRPCGRARGPARGGAPGPPQSCRRCALCAAPSRPRPPRAPAPARAGAADRPGAARCRRSPAWQAGTATWRLPRRRAPPRPVPGSRPAGACAGRGAPPTPAGARRRCAGRKTGCGSSIGARPGRRGPGSRARAGRPDADGSGCARRGSPARNPGSARRAGCRARRCGGGLGRRARPVRRSSPAWGKVRSCPVLWGPTEHLPNISADPTRSTQSAGEPKLWGAGVIGWVPRFRNRGELTAELAA